MAFTGNFQINAKGTNETCFEQLDNWRTHNILTNAIYWKLVTIYTISDNPPLSNHL